MAAAAAEWTNRRTTAALVVRPKLPYLCQQDSNFTGKGLAKIIDIPKKQMSDDDHIKKIPI